MCVSQQSMGIELVVLDFDGTITEIDREAGSAVERWIADIGRELGLSDSEINQKWFEAQTRIETDPKNYGWLMGNRIVAPAYADPLVMARIISDLLFDEAGIYMDRPERENILQNRFFKENYGKMSTVFKEEADYFLSELQNKWAACIVTNSSTGGVEKKIVQLPTDHSAIPILGDAKKYVLESSWKAVPESVERLGYGRPLFLQRKKYGDVLTGLIDARGLKPEQVAVVGDIYELDLLLPEYLGMHIILTPRDSTPTFEIEAVRTSLRGYAASSLREVLTHLESLKLSGLMNGIFC